MSERRGIHSERAPRAIGPYGHAMEANGFVYTSGQIGLDPASGSLREGVGEQAEQALTNLAAVLEDAGSGMERVVKTTIFLADMGDFPAVNEVYARHVGEPYPARSTIAVRALPREALVEIEMIALAGELADG